MMSSIINPSLKHSCHQLINELQTTVQWKWVHQSLTRNLGRENHFVNFLTYFMSNRKILSANWVLLRKNSRQSGREICCSLLLKSKKSIPKSMHLKNNIYEIELYRIHRFKSHQYQKTA